MKALFVVPGSIDTPTGGYRYDRMIIEEMRKLGADIELLSLQGSYPFPTAADKEAALLLLDEIKGQDMAVVDGLAGGAHPAFVKALSERMPVISLLHHPLCLENGLDPSQITSLKKSEAQGLKHCSAVITTSPATSRTVADLFGFPSEKIHHVLPGVERGKIAEPQKGKTTNLLCIGSIIRRKGHLYLIKALAGLIELDWRLDCVGLNNLETDLDKELEALVSKLGLSDRITFHGAVEENKLEAFFEHAHCFVLPSLYEGYGMAYAEAIVRGLPVIGTTAGAIPETVPSDCGLLVAPENVEELTAALKTMVEDDAARERMRLSALQSAQEFPDWQKSAKKFLKIMSEAA